MKKKKLTEIDIILCSTMIEGIILRADVNELQISKLCGIRISTIRKLYAMEEKCPRYIHKQKIGTLYMLHLPNPPFLQR